jgi:uncharacterized protein YcbX
MPHVARISIYPIKSLDGVSVDNARVLTTGALAYDRRLAMLDEQGQVINGKRLPAVHGVRLAFDPDTARVRLSSSRVADEASDLCTAHSPHLAEWLGKTLGQRVTLVENEWGGFPDDTDYPGPTVVSTATLERVAQWFRNLSLDNVRARFRANLEIDGVPAFWEDRLVPSDRSQAIEFRIGEVTFWGANPCARCAVPTRDPYSAQVLERFAKTFAERRAEELPSWAPRERFDHFYRLTVNTCRPKEAEVATIRLGDEVEVLGPCLLER